MINDNNDPLGEIDIEIDEEVIENYTLKRFYEQNIKNKTIIGETNE